MQIKDRAFYTGVTPISVSVFSRVGESLVSADLTKVPDVMNLGNSTLNDVLQNYPGTEVFYFNRLYVPVPLRGTGLGTALLRQVIDAANKHQFIILNDVNSYDTKVFPTEDLVDFYIRSGFEVLQGQSLLFIPQELKMRLTT